MGLFVYTQKGSIISMVDLPTTEIIEPKKIVFPSKTIFFLTVTLGYPLYFCYKGEKV